MPGIATAPPRREQALAYIVEQIVRFGISPTNEEIGDALGVGKTRARVLVKELIDHNHIRRTPGAQRGLQICDMQLCRQVIVERLRVLGVIVADPLGDLKSPCPQEHLPRLSPFEHLPDEH